MSSGTDLTRETPVDKLGRFVVTADVTHKVVHEEGLYDVQINSYDASFDSTDIEYLAVTMGSQDGHAVWEAGVLGGNVLLETFIDPTMSGGTDTAAYNHVLGSAAVPSFACKYNPVVSNAGTKAGVDRLLLGNTSGATRTLSSTRKDVEIMLPANKTTLFKLTAKADNIAYQLILTLYGRTPL